MKDYVEVNDKKCCEVDNCMCVIMKDYVEVNDKKCCEVDNCMCVIMKDYVEVNDKKCCEVDNCMCVKHENGKKYCMGCGNVVPTGKDKQ